MNLSNVKDINVKAGQNFQIQVPYTGFPKPTAVWMNGTKEIEDDLRVHLKVAEDHVLLTNTKAERGDAGRYRLTLKNPSGQDSGSLNVNVLGTLPNFVLFSLCHLIFCFQMRKSEEGKKRKIIDFLLMRVLKVEQ